MVAARGVRAEEVEPYTDDIELYPVEIELIEDESQPPDTDDEDKIREYWDTHAVTDFNSEPVPREEWPVGRGVAYYTLRIEREDVYKLADLAEAEGGLAFPMAEKLLNRAISEAHAAKFGTSEPTERIRRWKERVSEGERSKTGKEGVNDRRKPAPVNNALPIPTPAASNPAKRE